MTEVLAIDPGFSEVRVAVLAPGGEAELHTLRPSVDPFGWFEGRYGACPSGIVIAGGYYAPCSPGTYPIDERMAEDAARLAGWHPRNRMTVRAFEYCRRHGIPGVAVDPMSSIVLPEEARFTGSTMVERRGIYYAFPERPAFVSACASLGLDPEVARGISAYLGDEVSVASHHGSRAMATGDPIACEGPFGMTGAGTLPATAFIDWLDETGRGSGSGDEIRESLKRRSGVFAYAGVTSMTELRRELARESLQATRAVRAMAYQVSKEIGRAMAALKGRAEVIVLTGPGASLDLLLSGIEERVAKWCRVACVAQDDCMRVLAREGSAALTAESLLSHSERRGPDVV